MAMRIYTLYSAAAAGANLANVQVLAPGQVVGISFNIYGAAGNGVAAELSTSAARQFGTNNTVGIIGACTGSFPAAATGPISANHFIALAGKFNVNRGDFLYYHATQLGAGGTCTVSVNVYILEA